MAVVSVIIPTYNRSQALRPTLDSVLEQTYEDWELLLVDDGSSDDTGEVCREYTRRDRRIRYLPQANAGGAAARARGLSATSAEYVAFLDHDDLWLPHKLALQVERLAGAVTEGWVYGRFDLVHSDGKVVGDFHRLYGANPYAGWIQVELLLHQNFIGTYSNPLIRRSLLIDAGGPRAEAGLSDDWDLFIRLAGAAPIGFLDETLFHYDAGNPESQSRGDMERAYRCEERVLQLNREAIRRLSFPQRWALSCNARRRWGRWLKDKALWAQRDGEFRMAAHTYALAARVNPLLFANPAAVKDLLALFRRRSDGRGAGR